MKNFHYTPITPDSDDLRAYSRGYFPAIILGNHVQWAINYLGISEILGEYSTDSFPRHRMYLVEAATLYLRETEND